MGITRRRRCWRRTRSRRVRCCATRPSATACRRSPSTNADATGTDAVGYFAEGHGVSGFAREGDSVYHCYSSYARGTEFLMSYYAILDRTPRGREPADAIGSWVRRHDEYVA